jgi:MFS family permease
VSSFGDWLGFLATTALAAQLVDTFQGRAYATGGVLVFRLLPAVLLGPVAGAFADRWDRKRTMVCCDVLRFLLFLSIPIVGSVADRDTALVHLLVTSFFIETVSLFWIPAKEASVPNIVGPERLEGANQLTLIATYGSAPVAAVVFGLLSLVSRALGSGFEYFRTGPVDLALYANAATFLFAAVTVYRLEIPGGRRCCAATPTGRACSPASARACASWARRRSPAGCSSACSARWPQAARSSRSAAVRRVGPRGRRRGLRPAVRRHLPRHRARRRPRPTGARRPVPAAGLRPVDRGGRARRWCSCRSSRTCSSPPWRRCSSAPSPAWPTSSG